MRPGEEERVELYERDPFEIGMLMEFERGAEFEIDSSSIGVEVVVVVYTVVEVDFGDW